MKDVGYRRGEKERKREIEYATGGGGGGVERCVKYA